MDCGSGDAKRRGYPPKRVIPCLGSARLCAKHRHTTMFDERTAPQHRIGDRDSAAALFAPTFAGLAHEALRVAYLDGGLALLRLWKGDGTTGSVDVPLRTLIRDALMLGAHALIVAHNHPLGDPTPSSADKAVTRRLVEIARPLDIRVVDHLIFSGERVVSFRGLGLL